MEMNEEQSNFTLTPRRALDEGLFAKIEQEILQKRQEKLSQTTAYQRIAAATLLVIIAVNIWAVSSYTTTQSNDESSLVNFYLSEFYNE